MTNLFAILLATSVGCTSPPKSSSRTGERETEQSFNLRTVSSPSGDYSVGIATRKRATDRLTWLIDGLRLYAHGDQIWCKQMDFQLEHLIVTDGGYVAAFGYGYAPITLGGRRSKNLHLLILGPDGQTILDQRHSRRQVGMGFPPTQREWSPFGKEVIAIPAFDAVIFRVGSDIFHEAWWVNRLSDGQSLGSFAVVGPSEVSKGSVVTTSAQQVEHISGTPLVLAHQYRAEWDLPDESIKHRSSRFILYALDGKEIWRKDLRGDYDALPDGEGGWTTFHDRHPSILRTDQGKSFEVRFFRENKRVRYSVAQDESGRWVVQELESTNYTKGD